MFLEQPDPVVKPLGTQVEVSCAVNFPFRTIWSILLPGREMGSELSSEISTNVDFLTENHGIVTNVSSAGNREPLRINGIIGNNGTTVQCIAINLTDLSNRCLGRNFLVTFFGKEHFYVM